MAVIKGRTPTLSWLADLLSFFQSDAITIPTKYRDKVLEVKKLLKSDTSGLVNTILDFGINSALVTYRIETSNPNLTELLNKWLDSINTDLRGKIPTGLEALAKEYFRERWKGSSQLLLRTFWGNEDDFMFPNTLFFLDGEDIKCKQKDKNGAVILGNETYYIRIDNHEENDIKLPKTDNELIFVQKPYESWGTKEPEPYVIRKGLFRNLKFFNLMSQKGEYVFQRALEYLLVIKKGSEALAKEGKPEYTYSEEDLKKVSKDLKTLLASKKSGTGTPTYTTGFDTGMEHLIPEYQRILNDTIYAPVEKRILAGLGLVDIVEGAASSRREAILNPKPFISEVKQGIKDFKAIINDIIQVIIEKNQKKHPKWMGARIDIYSSPITDFMDDKVKVLLRSMYDRGSLSKRTLVEVAGELDYDLEVQRRTDEKEAGHEKLMFAPVIQNTGDTTQNKPANKDSIPDDKKGPEADNFKKALEEGKIVKKKDGWHVISKDGKNLGGPYKTRKQAEKRLSQVEYFKHKGVEALPSGAQNIWIKVFDSAYPKGESYAIEVAWTAVENAYKKVEDKWLKRNKDEVEEHFRGMDIGALIELKKLELLEKQHKVIDGIIKEDNDANTE